MENNYLSEKNKKSSIRLVLMIGMIMTGVIFISISYCIVIYGGDADFNWMGVAAVITSLAAFIGALVTGKVMQKKNELV